MISNYNVTIMTMVENLFEKVGATLEHMYYSCDSYVTLKGEAVYSELREISAICQYWSSCPCLVSTG